jgi:hypothetical protein
MGATRLRNAHTPEKLVASFARRRLHLERELEGARARLGFFLQRSGDGAPFVFFSGGTGEVVALEKHKSASVFVFWFSFCRKTALSRSPPTPSSRERIVFARAPGLFGSITITWK